MTETCEEDELVLGIECAVAYEQVLSTIGDIFLTTQGMYFVPYTSFASAGIGEIAAAAAFGGVLGVYLSKSNERRSREDALREAARERDSDYGLSIGDRVKLRTGQLRSVASRQGIADIHVDGYGTLCVSTKDRQSFKFAVPPLSAHNADILRRYATDVELGPDAAQVQRYGLDLPFPGPKRTLQMLADAANSVSTDMITVPSDIDRFGRYGTVFYSLLRDEPTEVRYGICQKLNHLSPSFAAGIRREAAKDAKFNYLFYGFIALCFAGFGSVVVYQCVTDGDISNAVGNGVLFGGFALALVSASFWATRRARGIAKALSTGEVLSSKQQER